MMDDLFAQDDGKPTTLRAVLPTRFPHDSRLNGVHDDEYEPRMPFTTKHGEAWASHVLTLDIDIESGKVVGWPADTTADINNKVVDMGIYSILNASGAEICEASGCYVPKVLRGEEWDDDYVEISIAADGSVKGWQPMGVLEIIQSA